MAPHVTYPPHPSLKPFVRYYWALDIRLSGASVLNLHVTADRFPRLVIQCLDGRSALHSSYYDVYAANLKGIASKPALVHMESTYSHIAVSFYPHGIKALFGIDAHETIDAVLDLHDFCPKDVIQKIMETKHDHVRMSIIDDFLLSQLRRMKPVDSRVIDFLHLDPGSHYGKQLKRYKISERQFERKFLQSIGITPSFYRRILRFEAAFSRIQHGYRKTLADLAYELGYSDQSHFNREFKAFSSQTPGELIARHDLVRESGSLLAE